MTHVSSVLCPRPDARVRCGRGMLGGHRSTRAMTRRSHPRRYLRTRRLDPPARAADRLSDVRVRRFELQAHRRRPRRLLVGRGRPRPARLPARRPVRRHRRADRHVADRHRAGRRDLAAGRARRTTRSRSMVVARGRSRCCAWCPRSPASSTSCWRSARGRSCHRPRRPIRGCSRCWRRACSAASGSPGDSAGGTALRRHRLLGGHGDRAAADRAVRDGLRGGRGGQRRRPARCAGRRIAVRADRAAMARHRCATGRSSPAIVGAAHDAPRRDGRPAPVRHGRAERPARRR